MAVRYFVSNVESSIVFYRDRLGFDVIEQWGPAFAIVQKGDQTLWLSGPGTSASRPMLDGSEPGPGGWNRIVVEVEDIESLAAHLQGLGTVFRGGIIGGPGGQQVLIEDGDGNPIELFENRDS